MSNNELSVRYEVDGTDLTLTPNIVLRYLTGGRTDIPEPEIAKFMMLCKAQKLNPFTGDVFMTAYNSRDGVKTQVTVGKNLYTKRAQRNPKYRGSKAGVTFLDGQGVIRHREGSAVYKEIGEKLIGGWANIYVDGFEQPVFDEVSFSEYNTGKSLWASKPGTMIRKVALVHALREAFPDEFNGLYDRSEMGVDEPEPQIQPIEADAFIDDIQPWGEPVEPDEIIAEADRFNEDSYFEEEI